MTQQPEDTQLEKYVITDEWGQTFYIHCKVLYEEITEEFLFNNYHIRKAPHRKESKLGLLPVMHKIKNNTPSKVVKKLPPKRRITAINVTRKNARRKESAVLSTQAAPSPTGRRNMRSRKNSVFRCLDEMDMRGTPHSKFNIKARNAFQEAEAESLIRNQKYFVPVALCVKTKNSSYSSADKLLLALIYLLYTNQNLYRNDIQNLIYSYSEFMSEVMLLTHIISPPPMTEYEVDVGVAKVDYAEGSLTEFRVQDDSTQMQLFALLSVECVVTMWTALLLDMRVILYVENTNDYFFAIKGLSQLMFPLRWQYSKGIAPEPSLLLQPVPYVYGVMKTLFPNKNEIFRCLIEEDVPYIFLDVNDSTISLSSSDILPQFPGEFSLTEKLQEIFSDLDQSELLKLSEKKQVELSRRVRTAFLSELTPYVRDIEKVTKRAKTSNYFVFASAFIENFERQNPQPGQRDFLKTLVQSQSFAVLFDELFTQVEGNYSRFEAMKLRDAIVLEKPVKVGLLSSQAVVLSRVSRLAEVASKENSKHRVNPNDSFFAILDRVKVDWINEIFRMQRTMEKVKEKTNRRGSDEILSASSNASLHNLASPENPPPVRNAARHCQFKEKDSWLRRGIFKSATIYMRGAKQMRLSKPRIGILFYGPKGILSFCQELFSLSNDRKNAFSLVQDIKPFLDRLRSEHTTKKSQSVIESANPIKQIPNESVHSTPQLRTHSGLLSALIDSKSLAKLNFKSASTGQLMSFSSVNSCQFFLFCAMYYTKYYENPYEIIKVKLLCDWLVLFGSIQAAQAQNIHRLPALSAL